MTEVAPWEGAVLSLQDATRLAQASVAAQAAMDGLDVIFLKGIGAQAHGLRPGHVSTDVDVLCRGEDLEAVARQLVARGWSPRPKPRTAAFYSAHAVTYFHPSWPCDIDVHIRFPGLLLEPDDAFEKLFEASQVIQVAGVPSLIPSLLDSIVILAAHSARTRNRRRDSDKATESLAEWVVANLDIEQRSALVVRARALGAALACLALTDRLGVDAEPSTVGALSDSERAWLLTEASGHSLASALLNEIRLNGPWKSRRAIASALWPSRDDILLALGWAPSRWGRVKYRLARAYRGAASVGSSLRASRASRYPARLSLKDPQ